MADDTSPTIPRPAALLTTEARPRSGSGSSPVQIRSLPGSPTFRRKSANAVEATLSSLQSGGAVALGAIVDVELRRPVSAVDPRGGASRWPSAASGAAPVSASAAAAALQQRSPTRSPTRRDGSPTARISKVWSTHMPHEVSAQASSIIRAASYSALSSMVDGGSGGGGDDDGPSFNAGAQVAGKPPSPERLETHAYRRRRAGSSTSPDVPTSPDRPARYVVAAAVSPPAPSRLDRASSEGALAVPVGLSARGGGGAVSGALPASKASRPGPPRAAWSTEAEAAGGAAGATEATAGGGGIPAAAAEGEWPAVKQRQRLQRHRTRYDDEMGTAAAAALAAEDDAAPAAAAEQEQEGGPPGERRSSAELLSGNRRLTEIMGQQSHTEALNAWAVGRAAAETAASAASSGEAAEAARRTFRRRRLSKDMECDDDDGPAVMVEEVEEGVWRKSTSFRKRRLSKDMEDEAEVSKDVLIPGASEKRLLAARRGELQG